LPAPNEARVVALLQVAKKLVDEDNARVALGLIVEALDHDCGSRPADHAATRELIRAYVPLLLQSGRFPATLANLAAIFYAWGDRDLGVQLLKKYARTVTTMPWVSRWWLTSRLYLRVRSRLHHLRTRIVVCL
jgi:hypothetical protein